MPKENFASRAFGAISALVVRYPWWIIGVFLALTVASVAVTVLKLEMRTNQNELVSQDLPYNQRYLAFLKEFGDLEFLYVVVEVDGDPRLAMRIVDAVAEEMGKLTEHVQEVHYRIPPESFGDSLLFLSPEDELRGLAKAAQENAELLKRLGSVDGFAKMFGFFADSFDASLEEMSPELARWGFHVLDATLDSVAAAARGDSPAPLDARLKELAEAADSDPRHKGYLFSKNHKLAFVEIMPGKNYETLQVISGPLAEIRKALDRVRERFRDARPGGIKLGLTGRPVLAADEMATTNRDMTVSTFAALAGVLFLFVVVFRRMRRPILACFALVVGIALTFGLVTITIGYLTLLSIVFAAMLVGMGIDFGIHYLARYQQELLATDSIEGSIYNTLVTTGLGIWTGGITTAAAFYSSLFVHFKGLAELGFVAGTGLIICLVTMLVFLPAMILVTDRNIRAKRGLHPPSLVEMPLLGSASRHPRTTLAILLALTVAGFYHFRGVPYDWNLLDLQARNLESVDYELKIIQDSDHSTWYAAFVLDSLDKVDKTLEALKPARDAGIVGDVESIRDFLAPDQTAKREILKPARDVVSRVALPSSSGAFDAAELRQALGRLRDRLDDLQSLVASRGRASGAEAVKAIEGPIRRIEALEDLLEKQPAEISARLSKYQPKWFGELGAMWGRLSRLLDPPEITAKSLPLQIHRRLVSEDEKRFLINAYPAKDVWEEKNMEEFVRATRKVDPDVTGTPVQVYESARLMRDAFLLSSLYSLVLVFALIVLDFRDLKGSSLAMLPLFVGLLWTLQLMPLLGLDFNLANFFALPILIGYGVDGGVHVIHRFREVRSTADVGRTTGSAITLSSLTSIVGFGAMGFAHHRGVASLGILTALGCAMQLIAAVVLLPSLLELHESRRKRNAQGP